MRPTRSSRSRSRALCQRSSGSFARHVLTMRSSAAGRAAARCDTRGGSSFRIAPIRLARVLPSNAGAPVSISYSTAPNAKMSVRASASCPSSCSGAMYWNVPRIVPCAVRFGGVVGSIDRPLAATTGAALFARPKSSSLAPALVSMMLPASGRDGRCPRDAPCRARRRSRSRSSAPRASGSGPARRAASASVSPSRYSITRKSTPPRSWPTSYSVQMCG